MDDVLNAEVKKTLDVLVKGGVILYPTDTVWGIGCDATNAEAINRIYKLKERAENKAMIVLLHRAEELMRYIKEVPDQAWKLIEYSSKPLTIIYDHAIGLPKNLISEDGSIAIRITTDPFCKLLIEKLKHPLISTSANISGKNTPQSFNEISSSILHGVDYVVNLRQQEKSNPAPSTIIKLDTKGRIKIIRK